MKCKLQDNLEFVQWLKQFWDQNFPGGEYDAVARRKSGAGKPGAVRSAPLATGRKPGVGSGSSKSILSITTTIYYYHLIF